jgi:hypothetical protein
MVAYPSGITSSTVIGYSPTVDIYGLPGCTNSEVRVVTSGTGITPFGGGNYVNDVSPGVTSYNSTSKNITMVWTTTGVKSIDTGGNIYYGTYRVTIKLISKEL